MKQVYHPHIKSGEVYVGVFNRTLLDNVKVNAVCNL